MSSCVNSDCQLDLVKNFYGISVKHVWESLKGNFQSTKTGGRKQLPGMSGQQDHPWPALLDMTKTRDKQKKQVFLQ